MGWKDRIESNFLKRKRFTSMVKVYAKVRTLKTLLGIGILVFYYTGNDMFQISLPVLLIGVLLYLWTVIEEVVLYRKKQRRGKFQAGSDFVLVLGGAIYIITHLSNFNMALSGVTLFLLAVHVLIAFLSMVNKN